MQITSARAKHRHRHRHRHRAGVRDRATDTRIRGPVLAVGLAIAVLAQGAMAGRLVVTEAEEQAIHGLV
jgi:hypothetical protein